MYSITLDLNPDPDPNWAKIMDQDPNSMYSDPQNCLKVFIKASSSSGSALNSFVSVYCSLHYFLSTDAHLCRSVIPKNILPCYTCGRGTQHSGLVLQGMLLNCSCGH